MVYRFRDNSSSLLFCTLLTSAIILYFIHLPILLEAFAQDSNYLKENHINIQNLDVKNQRFDLTTTPTATHNTSVDNINSKTATANANDGLNVIERVSD